MFSKFKDYEIVIVNGFGKFDNKKYENQIAVVVCRDTYFRDYNVRFQDGSEDWLDEKFLRKVKGITEYENKLYQNNWF